MNQETQNILYPIKDRFETALLEGNWSGASEAFDEIFQIAASLSAKEGN